MLKDRNIALVIAARFVSRLGGSAAFFVGVWGVAAYEFKATPQQLAWMMMASAIAGGIGSMVAGVLIDRFGPRRVLIGAELLTIPVVLALAFSNSFVAFAAWNALFAFVGVPTFTAGASFAPYMVSGKENLEKMNSLIEAAGSLGFVLGPAVGAIVSATLGLRAVLGVMALGALLAAGLAALSREMVANHRDLGHPLADLKAGLKVAYSMPSLRFLLLSATTIWLGFGAFSALEPLFYRDVVGVGAEWIGWMNTVYGAGLVFGAWLLPKLGDRVLNTRGVSIMTVLVGLGTLAYVGTNQLPTIALGALVWGTILGAGMPLIRTLLHLDAPHDYVGRVMGSLQYHQSAAELVPLAIAPALAAIFGVQAVLIASGLIVAAIALVGYPVARRIDAQKARLTGSETAEVQAADVA